MAVQDLITAEALRLGIDPQLALAVARRESGFNQSARGSSGEIGVFQLMPGTARDLGVNPYDLSQNIAGGVRYLKQQIDRFGPELGLAAYNGGPGNVARGTISDRARRYAAEVLQQLGVGTTAAQSAILPTFELPDPPELDALTIGAAAIGAIALLSLWT